MDLVTHGLVGAAIGQAGFSHKLGRRALGWGAIVGMVPDLDVLVKVGSNPFAEILYHRGITHSLWFGPVVGSLFGYLLWRTYKREDSLSAWIGLCIWALLAHCLLDFFTVYGTQLLAPFSYHLFTLPAVSIIDPLYSGLLFFAIMFGILFHRRLTVSRVIASSALVLTTGYLFYGLAQNDLAESYARTQLASEGQPRAEVHAYTTMFQIFLRRVVVHTDNEVWVGFVSTWAPKQITWHKHPQAPLAVRQAILNHPYGQIFQWFTGDELIFAPNKEDTHQWDVYDARFGYVGDTLWGIWGRTVTVDANGNVRPDFVNFRMPFPNILTIIKTVWKDTFNP